MRSARRIVSLLPSASEMVCALGLGDRLVGVTHECDHPAEAKSKPAVVRNALALETMTQREIDVAVSARLRDGLGLYELDTALIERLSPDLIITQSLCDVCAPSGTEIAELLRTLSRTPEILWMTPRSLAEIDENLRDLGRATGRPARAERLIAEGRARLSALEAATRSIAPRPRVFCMEWLDPVYCSGHWVPEMVRIAGGEDALGRLGADSVRIGWDEVLAWAPEVLVVMPCGYDLEAALQRMPELFGRPGFHDLPAARDGRVYGVDANSYFARPGPRAIDGAELLAHLIRPDRFAWAGPAEAYRRIDTPGLPAPTPRAVARAR
ncbi:MAG TPA: cobalamin-binding protein [Caulobacteraceae bacterium]|jgi:iron complex transport system substrate-binding protein|nr:cobalamin-binding protein [Caulobacteraceae bacterium]